MATEEHTPLRRVVAASMIGTTIEWYDFFLYGSPAAIFNHMMTNPCIYTCVSR